MSFDDLARIRKWLEVPMYEESNHNALNLYLWENWYPIWIKETDNWLLLFGLHEGEVFMYMPLCDDAYLELAFKDAMEEFKLKKKRFILRFCIEPIRDRVLNLYPHMNAKANEDSFDYVYDGDKLRTLSGKKYQKRRNHYNAFMKEYKDIYQYRRMESTDVSACLELLRHWKTEDPDVFLKYEREGTEYILKNWDIFTPIGGVIEINGIIEAFVIGSLLSKHMVQLNIMKANHTIRGLYQAIEKDFLNDAFPDVTLVNKEDDAGNASLRSAKRAYYPITMVEKYRISEE